MKTLKSFSWTVLFVTMFYLNSNILAQKVASVEVGDAVSTQVQVCGVFESDRSLWVFKPGDPENVQEFHISEDAQNFDQIEVGDLININYYESVVLSLNAPGETPDESGSEVLVRAAKGEKPGGIAVEVYEISAIVQDYDEDTGVATLIGPKGNVLKTAVSEEVYQSGIVEIGQTVHVRYTQTLAISVDKKDY